MLQDILLGSTASTAVAFILLFLTVVVKELVDYLKNAA
jgi:hypothetical protein